MVLALNLMGALQELRMARTNKEKVEGTYRVVEEFFKTQAILLWIRYLSLIQSQKKLPQQEIRVLIDEFFLEPTFDAWIRLEKQCREALITMEDGFAKEFNDRIMSELAVEESAQAKSILREIHRLRSTSIDAPRKLTAETFLNSIRLLRNFRSHEWDTNYDLQPVIDLGIDEFVGNLLERMSRDNVIVLLKPISITPEGVETIEFDGIRKRLRLLSQANLTPNLGDTYLAYNSAEKPFQFKASIVKYDENANRCYVYLKWKKNEALFESISLVGGIAKQALKFENLLQLFDLVSTSPTIARSDSISKNMQEIVDYQAAAQESITSSEQKQTMGSEAKLELLPLANSHAASRSPTHHLTARMAWHDNKWNGTVCSNPEKNWYCTAERSLLSDRIAKNKDVELEVQNKGVKLDAIPGYTPPCFWTSAAFADDTQKIVHYHPFDETKTIPETLGNYSIFTWPFRLSFIHNKKKKATHGNYPPDLEDRIRNFTLKFKGGQSIVFFYLNYDNPILFEDESKYVLVGCALMKEVKGPLRFDFSPEELSRWTRQHWARNFPTINWAFQVLYDFKQHGVMLPYHEYLQESEQNPIGEELLKEMRILIKEEPLIFGFKYVAADIDADACIYLLTKLRKSIKIIQRHGVVKLGNELEVIDNLLRNAWVNRGLYPSLATIADIVAGDGLGQQLIERIVGHSNPNEADLPTRVFDVLLGKGEIPPYLSDLKPHIARTRRDAKIVYYRRIPLLKKLSLLVLTKNQINRILSPNKIEVFKKHVTDEQIVQNPYILFEEYISADVNRDEEEISDFPIGLFKIDIGMFPDTEYLQEDLELQNLSPVGPERLRAVIIDYLMRVGQEGHCYATQDDILKEINSHPLFYKDEIALSGEELVAEDSPYSEHFQKRLRVLGHNFFYLNEVIEAEKLIKETILKLAQRPDYTSGIYGYEEFVVEERRKLEKNIQGFDGEQFSQERNNLFQKVLKKSFFIISGKPGSGKTKVLQKIIAEINDKGEGVTLLAPTGKAALRLAKVAGDKNAQTIDRYIFEHKYNDCLDDFENIVIDKKREKLPIRNLVIDESSMVDLQKLAILFKMVYPDDKTGRVGLKRLILVGDENQLPPIGFGRPFFDIIEFIRSHPQYRVTNYVELVTNCRQTFDTKILRVAEAFVGKNRYYSGTFNELLRGGDISSGLSVELWKDDDELRQKISEQMDKAIKGELADAKIHCPIGKPEQINALFGLDFSGSIVGNYRETLKLDSFQILSPYRGGYYGTLGLNQFIRSRFKDFRKNQQIRRTTFVHSDKIIRVNNWYGWDRVTRLKTLRLSNGSIGVVCLADNYGKGRYYFSDASDSFDYIDDPDNFELAYAITVHKSQGSEFKNVFLIIPQKLSLLSKELLYTALTRSTGRVTIFLQSSQNRNETMNLLEKVMHTSFTLPRNTSIFDKPVDSRTKIQPSKGIYVKSRIEYILFDALEEAGFQFEYEKPMTLSNKNYPIRPDFTIAVNGKTYYWEHLGKLDTGSYYNDWQERKNDYEKNGVYDSLITTDELGGIVKEKILAVINDIRSESIRQTPSSPFSLHHYQLY